MFDPTQLRTFLAVDQARSFTQAARRLGLRQSTVSQHIRKLEATAGRQLFVRDTHTVEPTPDGTAMIEFAGAILHADDRAMRYFAGAELRGRVRFGVSEDLVLTELPSVLREFRRNHPRVDLELTVALSETLRERLHVGELDLVFGKRRPGEQHGRLVWREQLGWAGADDTVVDPDVPIPLVAYPPPSLTRSQALAALENAGLEWRISCTSGHLNGLRAAVMAGLGVTVHTPSLLPPGMSPLPHGALPPPGDTEFVLMTRSNTLSGPARELSEVILASADRLQRP